MCRINFSEKNRGRTAMFLFISEIVLLVQSCSVVFDGWLAVSTLKAHNEIENTSLPNTSLEFAMTLAIFSLISHSLGTKLLYDCLKWQTREKRAKFLFPYVIARAVFVSLYFISVIVCEVTEYEIRLQFSDMDSSAGLLLGAVVDKLTNFLVVGLIMEIIYVIVLRYFQTTTHTAVNWGYPTAPAPGYFFCGPSDLENPPDLQPLYSKISCDTYSIHTSEGRFGPSRDSLQQFSSTQSAPGKVHRKYSGPYDEESREFLTRFSASPESPQSPFRSGTSLSRVKSLPVSMTRAGKREASSHTEARSSSREIQAPVGHSSSTERRETRDRRSPAKNRSHRDRRDVEYEDRKHRTVKSKGLIGEVTGVLANTLADRLLHGKNSPFNSKHGSHRESKSPPSENPRQATNHPQGHHGTTQPKPHGHVAGRSPVAGVHSYGQGSPDQTGRRMPGQLPTQPGQKMPGHNGHQMQAQTQGQYGQMAGQYGSQRHGGQFGAIRQDRPAHVPGKAGYPGLTPQNRAPAQGMPYGSQVRGQYPGQVEQEVGEVEEEEKSSGLLERLKKLKDDLAGEEEEGEEKEVEKERKEKKDGKEKKDKDKGDKDKKDKGKEKKGKDGKGKDGKAAGKGDGKGGKAGGEGSKGAPGGVRGAPGGARGAPGGSRGAPGGVRGVPGGASGAPGGARGAPGGVRGAPGGVRGAPGGATGALGGARGAPAGARGAAGGVRGTPGGARGGPSARGAPGGRMGAPGGRMGAPGGRMGAPGGRMGAPGGRMGAPGGRMGAPGGRMGAPGGRMGAPGGRMGAPGGRMGAPGGRMAAPGGRMGAPGGVGRGGPAGRGAAGMRGRGAVGARGRGGVGRGAGRGGQAGRGAPAGSSRGRGASRGARGRKTTKSAARRAKARRGGGMMGKGKKGGKSGRKSGGRSGGGRKGGKK